MRQSAEKSQWRIEWILYRLRFRQPLNQSNHRIDSTYWPGTYGTSNPHHCWSIDFCRSSLEALSGPNKLNFMWSQFLYNLSCCKYSDLLIKEDWLQLTKKSTIKIRTTNFFISSSSFLSSSIDRTTGTPKRRYNMQLLLNVKNDNFLSPQVPRNGKSDFNFLQQSFKKL